MPNPYIPEKSRSRFYVPKTLESDFDTFLENDIPGAVMDFTVLKDWYAQFEDGYTPKTIRGEIYPDRSKSRYANTDNNLNFRASKSSGIQKGDMVIDGNGIVYLFDWDIPPESNNAATRALRCNCMLTFTQYQRDEVDEDGYLISEGGDMPVAKDMPCNAYRYEGRPEFSEIAGMPGVVPNTLLMLTVQYNTHTAKLRTGAEFVYGVDTFVVIDVGYMGVTINGTHGTLNLQAKKKAGGEQVIA